MGPKYTVRSPPPPLRRKQKSPSPEPDSESEEEENTLDINDFARGMASPSPLPPNINTRTPVMETPVCTTTQSATPTFPGINIKPNKEKPFKSIAAGQRMAVTRAMTKFFETQKAKQVTHDQRWPMLRDLRQKALERYKENGNMLAAEHLDAANNKYSEKAELEALRKKYRDWLDGGEEEDEDDEEPETPNIKTEPADEDDSNRFFNHNRSEKTGREHNPKPAQFKGCVAVQRTYNLDRLIAESEGREYKPDPSKVRRQWRCVAPFGKMIVWPPYEQDASNAKKRKAEETNEAGRAKKPRI